ncbi:MAG: hypothetical protein QOI86_5112, partial [Actinomycetota bacterium]|nr:hypothetical protein [Actinomycetota bacterium]
MLREQAAFRRSFSAVSPANERQLRGVPRFRGGASENAGMGHSHGEGGEPARVHARARLLLLALVVPL